MRHFFSKDTVEAMIWCKKCARDTPHAVMGGLPAYCKVCQAKPLEESRPQDHPVERSGDLFG